MFFFLLLPRPPRPPLFPYTTLFRSRTARSACGRPVATMYGSTATSPISLPAPGNADKEIGDVRSEEHTSELQSLRHLVCRLLLEKKKKTKSNTSLMNDNGNIHQQAE